MLSLGNSMQRAPNCILCIQVKLWGSREHTHSLEGDCKFQEKKGLKGVIKKVPILPHEGLSSLNPSITLES